VVSVPAAHGRITVEELLFYVMGPVAIVLVYVCADERWLSKYNPNDKFLDLKLIQLSPRLAIVAAGAAVMALVLWRVNGNFPTYFVFISAGALLPAMLLFRTIGNLTNWPAFAVTMLYVIVTSLIWEVTLAIPRQWWGYEPSGMMGFTIAAWSRGEAIFPVEAAMVWP
jgi:lycopene cyclase domain-containing protein